MILVKPFFDFKNSTSISSFVVSNIVEFLSGKIYIFVFLDTVIVLFGKESIINKHIYFK